LHEWFWNKSIIFNSSFLLVILLIAIPLGPKETESKGQIEKDDDAVKWITEEDMEELEKIKITKAYYKGVLENGYALLIPYLPLRQFF
jgi:hypothetical protein